MRRLEFGEWLAVLFIGSGCALGALLGWLWSLRPVRGERET